ncbi:DUF4440 domain-containing protein [Amylibacter sp. SFDW26]|uniref:nuclear transport factor 2 family protein n=1 Tax=Amylibacter sp. SFDW26 TaxID=2652722 RepID=UPI001261911A|nr:nuclear transport factor 2 family protein [Amylibacter sp. SFDW26]KAB7615395.1 DUF4440 domain-containing protein [Amylibacter sp. SFDW26]
MSHSLKSAALAATLLLATSGAAFTDTATAEAKAENEAKIQMAVSIGSKAWKDAFNAGNAAGAAALYEDDAIMVVKPFGTFKGKDEILAFGTDLVSKGFDDVVYSKTTTTIVDSSSASVSASWTMNNAHGIITNEHWVIQEDGRALMREDHFEVAQ